MGSCARKGKDLYILVMFTIRRHLNIYGEIMRFLLRLKYKIFNDTNRYVYIPNKVLQMEESNYILQYRLVLDYNIL